MIIIEWRPSPERQQAFEAGLRHLVQLGRVPAGLNVDPSPQPVYLLSSKDAASHSLEAVKLIGWRYTAGDTSGEVVVGEVSADSPPAVISLRYGDSGQRILKATFALQKLPQLEKDNYLLRVLRIPGALMEGFWLKPTSGGTDQIAPFGKRFGMILDDNRPLIGADEFLRTLRPVAPQLSRNQETPPR